MVGMAGGKLFVAYLKDVTTRAYVYDLAGKLENEIALPGPGSASGFGGKHDDKFIFYTFNSFDFPPSIFRYDIATRTSTLFRAPEVPGLKRVTMRRSRSFTQAKTARASQCFSFTRRG